MTSQGQTRVNTPILDTLRRPVTDHPRRVTPALNASWHWHQQAPVRRCGYVRPYGDGGIRVHLHHQPRSRAACQTIRKLDGVVRADALFGGPPVVAIVAGDDLTAVDRVVDAIIELSMVTDTETHVTRDIPAQ